MHTSSPYTFLFHSIIMEAEATDKKAFCNGKPEKEEQNDSGRESFFSPHCNWGKMMALNISNGLGGWNTSPHLMENHVVATIQTHLWEVGPHCAAWLSSTWLPGSTARLYSSHTLSLSDPHAFSAIFSCCWLLRLLHSHIPVLPRSSSSTHPWKRPLFCSCWSRMFSSFRGLGMKPMSQPSFTRRPIHQSLLYFCRLNR